VAFLLSWTEFEITGQNFEAKMGGIVSGIREERKLHKLLRENTKINLLASEWDDPERPQTPDADDEPRSPCIIWKENIEMTGLYFPEVRDFMHAHQPENITCWEVLVSGLLGEIYIRMQKRHTQRLCSIGVDTEAYQASFHFITKIEMYWSTPAPEILVLVFSKGSFGRKPCNYMYHSKLSVII
jgi:hypothetical protein